MYVCMYIYMCMNVKMHAYKHIKSTCMHMHAQLCIQARIHVLQYTNAQAQTYMRTNDCTGEHYSIPPELLHHQLAATPIHVCMYARI